MMGEPAAARRILIDAGAAITRGVVIESGAVRQFHFAPAIGDPADTDDILVGDVFIVIARQSAPSMHGFFADMGDGRSALLVDLSSVDDPGAAPLTQGARVIATVKRAAIDEKRCVLSANWRRYRGADADRLAVSVRDAIEQKAPPGRLSAVQSPIERLLRAMNAKAQDAIIVDQTVGQDLVLSALPGAQVTVDPHAFAAFEVDDTIERALAETVPIVGGARMIISETAAMTAIDVDSGAHTVSGKQINDEVNILCADRLGVELARRSIGGRVVVDFLPSSNTEARRALFNIAKKKIAEIPGARAGRLAPDGLFDATVPRYRPSLLAQVSEGMDAEEGRGAMIRPARYLTADWRVKTAITALETALRGTDRYRYILYLGSSLMRRLEQRPEWSTRLIDRYGKRFDINPDDELDSRGFSLLEQP